MLPASRWDATLATRRVSAVRELVGQSLRARQSGGTPHKEKTRGRISGTTDLGAPTNEDEAGLRRLAAQIKAEKVVVKLFLKHPLHAKLYLLFRPIRSTRRLAISEAAISRYRGCPDRANSTLTCSTETPAKNSPSGLKTAGMTAGAWIFLTRSPRLSTRVGTREELIPPHHIYIKIAYHLSQEARAGLAEFRIPKDFGDKLLDFQTAAVKIAAHHLNRRGGVIIGDVVGLGKDPDGDGLGACVRRRLRPRNP